MHIYLCSAKIQMERLVYCVHEHVDRLFALKRQRYIWCFCTFTDSTNVRHFPAHLMLLGHFNYRKVKPMTLDARI